MIQKLFQRFFKEIEHTEEEHRRVAEKPELPNLISYLGFYSDAGKEVAIRVWQVARHYPASTSTHMNYIGGLWDHSLEVALKMSERFRDTRKAFIAFITGLLHDIGKIAFFKYNSQYIFHPLTFQPPPDGAKISFSSDKDAKHADISVFLAYHFLSSVIHVFTTDEVIQVIEAIQNHHSKTVFANEYLDVLKEIDKKVAGDDVAEIIPSPVIEERESVGEEENTGEGERDKVDLIAFREVFRKLISQGKFVADYHFYVVEYEKQNLLLITAPKSFHDWTSAYCEETGMMLHDSVFVKALENARYIAMLDSKDNTVQTKAVLKFNGKNRTLKFIILYASKFFSPEEIQQYLTKAESIKIRGTFLAG